MAGRRTSEPEPRKDLDAIKQWQRIFIDMGIALVAFFLFIYGALTIRDPAVLAIVFGAAAALLGIPIVRRVDTGGEQ